MRHRQPLAYDARRVLGQGTVVRGRRTSNNTANGPSRKQLLCEEGRNGKPPRHSSSRRLAFGEIIDDSVVAYFHVEAWVNCLSQRRLKGEGGAGDGRRHIPKVSGEGNWKEALASVDRKSKQGATNKSRRKLPFLSLPKDARDRGTSVLTTYLHSIHEAPSLAQTARTIVNAGQSGSCLDTSFPVRIANAAVIGCQNVQNFQGGSPGQSFPFQQATRRSGV